MCGFIFIKQPGSLPISLESFNSALKSQSWRGPDATHTLHHQDGKVLIGHNRLAVIDPHEWSDQPMVSADGRYVIAFNGEIYNHHAVRKQLALTCRTTSDTETILEGYAKLGSDVVPLLDGMFAFVIYDKITGHVFFARDRLGIKPLFVYEKNGILALGSEPAPLAKLFGLSVDPLSVAEWRIVRRPTPGFSYFSDLAEQLPGTWRHSSKTTSVRYWLLSDGGETFYQDRFEDLLARSVSAHELSDVTNVSLLSGGLDSAVITGLSKVEKSYCIGLTTNNEIPGAQDTADVIGRSLHAVSIQPDTLTDLWVHLTKLRGEPLSVPNEALIYRICTEMAPAEKVVLTGEGADELLFGYDGIYRWATEDNWQGIEHFLRRYGYSTDLPPTDRLKEFIESERDHKTLVEFVEDFFYKLHLPGLLRRMDFASMAASKEARVPFVDTQLIEYMYRKPTSVKLNSSFSKLPLRKLASDMKLHGALNRRKIGFSATPSHGISRHQEYKNFQNLVLGALQW